MKPCKSCPFRKDSPKGNTTFSKKDCGSLNALNGLLTQIDRRDFPHTCHIAIIKKKSKPCAGYSLFLENLNTYYKPVNKEIFESTFDLVKHHTLRL